jgi:hypothetical protein
MNKEEIVAIVFLIIFSIVVTIKYLIIDIQLSSETTNYNIINERFLK